MPIFLLFSSAGSLPHGARVFVLSPADLSGVRGRRIVAGSSGAPFMATLEAGGCVPLGDVYAFISSLYYRGKRAYGRTFGRPRGAVLSITSTRGLVSDDESVGLADLAELAGTDIDPERPTYRDALDATARALDRALDGGGEVVLLGSIATGKYLDPLGKVFGERLLFPRSFIGRGDMSRGGLLLRAVRSGEELEYVVALDAERRGSRPARLGPAGRPRRRGCKA